MQRTYCRICEAACGLKLDLSSEPRLVPDKEHPISRGHVCAKGTRFLEVNGDSARIVEPQVRRRGRWESTEWDGALAEVSGRLSEIINKYGENAVALYMGNPLGFHTLGLAGFQAFARALGTGNVYSAASIDSNNKFVGAQIVHGSPVIHPIPDFENTALAVLFGSNPAVSQGSFVHLPRGSQVFQGIIDRGGHCIWIDPNRSESAKRWGEHLPIVPGCDVFLMLCLLRHFSPNALHYAGQSLEPLIAVARVYDPLLTSQVTGISERQIHRIIAQVEGAKSTAFYMSLGVNQGPFGTLAYVCMQALSLLTGNLGHPGGSFFQPAAPFIARLSKAFGFAQNKTRSRVGNFPMVLDALPCGVLSDEILRPGEGQPKALIVVAGDPLRSIPDSKALETAIRGLDLVISIDMFENHTAKYADVLLPVPSWLERWDLSPTSAALQLNGLLPWAGAVLEPPPGVRNELKIFAQLATALKRPLWGSRLLTKLATWVNWDSLLTSALRRLGQLLAVIKNKGARTLLYGLPWPTPRGKNHQIIKAMGFWSDELNGEPQRLEQFAEQQKLRQKAGQMLLIGRRRRLGHNSWLRGATREGKEQAFALISPHDHRRLALAPQDKIVLARGEHELSLPYKVREGLMAGVVVVPHGLGELNINELIPSGPENIEPVSGQHIMGGVAVGVKRAL